MGIKILTMFHSLVTKKSTSLKNKVLLGIN